MTPVPSKLERVIRLIESTSYIGLILGWVSLILLTILVLIAALSRHLFNAPIMNSDEIAGFLLLNIILLGLAYTLRVQRHVRVDIVLRYLKPRPRAILSLVMTFIGTVWVIAVLLGSWKIWLYYLINQTVSSMGTGILLWIPCCALIIGSTLLLLQLLAEIFKRSLFVFEGKTSFHLVEDQSNEIDTAR